MLSNLKTNLQRQQQRQHRRQNSTPVAYDPAKVPILSPTRIHRAAVHKRGQSLDQKYRLQPRQSQQDTTTVSINPGFQHKVQHNLREAQQHRLVQPGQQHYQAGTNQQQYPFSTLQNVEPQNQEQADKTFNQQAAIVAGQFCTQYPSGGGPSYLDGLGLGLEGFTDFRVDPSNDINTAFTATQKLSTIDGLNCSPGLNSNSQDWLEYPPRPSTPLRQKSSSYHPLTPATTPFTRIPQTAPHRQKPPDLSPSLGDRTIRPARPRGHRRAESIKDVFSNHQFTEEPNGLPSPPNSATLSTGGFDIAPMQPPNFTGMNLLNMDFSGSDNDYESSYYSPMSSALSPAMSSLRSSMERETSQMSLFDYPVETMSSQDISSDVSSFPSSPTKGSFSHETHSMSMSDADPDSSIRDTGISIDEIASYIEGPDPVDGKWMCLYPECGKRFGRKENIKSHVQTHLGDRQYTCNHCQKCFVRQHDLKRHAKIHSGVKPYPCLCGNTFARHDALTRHRQRGMCIGAFEGIVKKPMKRGRPKKHRPDVEERQGKASRTRKAVAMSASSSSSGFSYQSAAASPMASQTFSIGGPSPEMFTYTPPSSPGPDTNYCVYPRNTQCSASPTLSTKEISSPPKLSNLSSSPPPLTISPSFTLCNSLDSGNEDGQITTEGGTGDSTYESPGFNSEVDEMFLNQFQPGSDLTTLERDPGVLLAEHFSSPSMDRFDDVFNETMYRSSGDGSEFCFDEDD